MKPILKRIRRFTDHPITKLALGLILVVSSIAEGYDTFFDDLGHLRFRAHHGLLIYGLANMLACLPDLVDGLDKAFGAFETQGLAGAAEALSPAEDSSDPS